ncbi:hypothetical protein EGH21_18660 [Halomicroarcula sp. F13]|jgi:hypothetical protein|uniref:Nucleotidyltransferase n=3 Tax=Haloarcula TaxID=2237 RepID=A0AAE4JIF6_9EURY|nr:MULTISPECIES: hypothetical protein [Haloarculaceae]MBX0325054.1 hypothetical protein [Halomicroarcula rubra]MDS0223687.1 hypothetical protein [Haloarcula terrestris]MDS0284347.1 hypothetical protein [Halomicroarcula sp. S3CR25-11]
MSQEDRSEALIEVLEELEQSDIGFVLVGGYAISQFEARFSTDLDRLGCRQTKAEWSFDYLRTHSSPTTISGGTQSTTARAADGEVLVAAKLHSGRKTDLADVLAAIPSINLDMVETHLHRGDADALRDQLSEAQTFIEEGGLDHRFKSMFGQSSASAEDIETLLEFLKRQQE